MFEDDEDEIRWVRIKGLQSAAGQKLNGKVGHVLTKEADSDGRFQVKIDGDASKGKLLKPANFADLPRDEMVKVVRLPSRGEQGQVPEVPLYPRDHSMFRCDPDGNAPIPRIVGVPLMVESTTPRLTTGDKTNQSAAALRIDPNGGFAPPGYEETAGPVLVYRPGGLDLGFADVKAMLDYISKLVEQLYSEEKSQNRGSDFDPHFWLNREYFHRMVRLNRKIKVKDLHILD